MSSSAAAAASASSLRKSRSDSAGGAEKSVSSRRGPRATAPAPGKRAGLSSSPNLLSSRSAQGMIKVEKIQLDLGNVVEPRRGAAGGRDEHSKGIRRGEGGGRRMGGSVGSLVAPPAAGKTAWRRIATRDTAAAIGFAESSVQELRKLAAARAAAQEESSLSSSSSGEGGGRRDGAAGGGGVHGECEQRQGGQMIGHLGKEKVGDPHADRNRGGTRAFSPVRFPFLERTALPSPRRLTRQRNKPGPTDEYKQQFPSARPW